MNVSVPLISSALASFTARDAWSEIVTVCDVWPLTMTFGVFPGLLRFRPRIIVSFASGGSSQIRIWTLKVRDD